MIIKNISGYEQYFHLSGSTGVRLANNASTTVLETPENVARVAELVAASMVEITSPPIAVLMVTPSDVPSYTAVYLADKGEVGHTLKVGVAGGDSVTFELYAHDGDDSGITEGNVGVSIGHAYAVDTISAATVGLAAVINADETLDALGIKVAGYATTTANGQGQAVIYLVRNDGDLATNWDMAETGDTFTVTAVGTDGTDNTSKVFTVVTKTSTGTPVVETVFTGLSAIDTVLYNVTTSAGVVVVPTGDTVTVEGGVVRIDPVGATFSEGDIITVMAKGTPYTV